jgi:hypothetical protein
MAYDPMANTNTNTNMATMANTNTNMATMANTNTNMATMATNANTNTIYSLSSMAKLLQLLHREFNRYLLHSKQAMLCKSNVFKAK